MEKVQFINLEDGDDIIISLSFSEGGKFGIDGFTIQRCPKLESILPPNDRGASIAWDEDDIVVLLDKVSCSRDIITFETRGKIQKHEFEISGLSDNDFEDLKNHLNLINFDNSFKLKFG
jgi:hypothetical protein